MMNITMMSCMLSDDTPRQIVNTAVECGMTSVDWITTHGTDPCLLGRMTRDAGLFVAAHTAFNQAFINDEPNWKDEFKQSLDDAVDMGAPILLVPPFALKKHPDFTEARKRWTEFYAWAAPLSVQAGVTLTVESTGFSYSPVTTAEEILDILHNVPDLKLTFDNGNTATACDFMDAYRKTAPYIVRFHFKDWKIADSPFPGAEKKRTGKYYADCPIGEGSLDLKAYWNEILPEQKKFTFNLETCDPSGRRTQHQLMKELAGKLKNW